MTPEDVTRSFAFWDLLTGDLQLACRWEALSFWEDLEERDTFVRIYVLN